MAKKQDVNINDLDKQINEELKQENGEISKRDIDAMNRMNTPKGKMLISGANFWDFEIEPEFQGYYMGKKVINPNDGKLMGYNFVTEDGEMTVIGASHSIVKAMEMDMGGGKMLEDLDEPHIWIRFDGKMTVKKSGRQFSRFTVMLLG